jgi:hypothetical protein
MEGLNIEVMGCPVHGDESLVQECQLRTEYALNSQKSLIW